MTPTPQTPLDLPACVDSYQQAGLILFPCGEGPQRKSPHPTFTSWQRIIQTPPNLLEISDIFAVQLPSTVIVIDYDPSRDTPGPQTQLQKLWAALQLPIANTFIVQSGSGGFHVYLNKPADVLVRNCQGLHGYPAIDVKTQGGYVIGAGSSHHTGNSYKIIRGDVTNLMDCPPALLDYVKFDPDRDYTSGTGASTSALVDSSDSIQRFVELCKTTRAAVTGDAGDKQTLVVAMFGKDFYLSEETTYEIMLAHYNHRCQPPWDITGLRSKVANAYNYNQNKPGSKHPSAAFEGVKIDKVKPPGSDRYTSIENKLAIEHNKRLQAKCSYTTAKGGASRMDNTLTNVLYYMRFQDCVVIDPDTQKEEERCNPFFKLFRYNLFAEKIEFTRLPPWQSPSYPNKFLRDSDIFMVKEWLHDNKLNLGTELVREAINIVSRENQFHPVKDWVRSIKWDGVKRLDTWLRDFMGAGDSPYIREIGKNTLIALIARVFDPGCQHDSMLVLEGPQESGKSSAVRVLGGEWYANIKVDTSPQGYVRTISALQGRWIVEMAELEVLRRSEIQAFKDFITNRTDIVRRAYGHFEEELPRQSGFIGTINPTGSGYLQDSTGNRRFWAVVTTDIDLVGLSLARDMLFAEAYERYKSGEAYHIVDESIRIEARNEQLLRMQQDAWLEIIQGWLERGGKYIEKLDLEAVAYGAINLPAKMMDKEATRRISTAMQQLGYVKDRKRINGIRYPIWKLETVETLNWL